MTTMSKTKDTIIDEQNAEQPDFVKELLEKGSVIITSLTREDFDAMLKEIPTDVKYMAGAVGFNHDMGVFSLRLDINNN